MKNLFGLIALAFFFCNFLNAQTVSNSILWNSNSYEGSFWEAGTPLYVLAHDGVNWRPANADRVRSFLNIPSGGETLQSVTDRGNATTQNIQMMALTLYGQSLGFNRDITNGFIFNNARHAYQFQHSPSANPNDDNFALQVYRPDGANVTPYGLVINGNGNVGIGTVSPAYKLDVNGGLRAMDNVAIRKGNVDNGLEFQTEAMGSYLNIQASNAGFNIPKNLSLNVYGGNVGIGTTNPGYKLAVEGTIGARKIKVTQESWADYVFDSSYQLSPLSHVEKFIQENKHLPEVPSAIEVKKNGLDLGDNQAILLKKIEELTLYIIQMEKRVAQLEENRSKSCQ